MEEKTDIQHSKSAYLNAESPGSTQQECEEYEMQNPVKSKCLGVHDVLELLQQQHAIISGGKSKEGCPILTFPDNNNFETLSDVEYQRLMTYLTAVPSLHDADLGFHLIIDRRNDRWNSVKTVLLKISVYFPGLIHVVYVLKPASFLQKVQKAVSEVSNKFFKDDFKFRMVVLNSAEELHKYINSQQLTSDLGGTLPYCHNDWIQQRIQLESFSLITQQVSNVLDGFTKTIDETELPNDVESIQLLLTRQSIIYSDLKQDILSAAKHGEDLLAGIKEKSIPYIDGVIPENGTIFAIERLLVQLEETEKRFNIFWLQHSKTLRNCIELRRFEQDFRELQVNFEKHIKNVAEMIGVGDTLDKIDNVLRQAKIFEKMCCIDINRAEEVISAGQHLMKTHSSPMTQCVEPKCIELDRIKNLLVEKISEKIEVLETVKIVVEKINKANSWSSKGEDLLTSQNLEQCSNNMELIDKYVADIQDFLTSSREISNIGSTNFENRFQDKCLSQVKSATFQALERVEEMKSRCSNQILFLNKVANQFKRNNSIVPKQPQIGAPTPITGRILLKKAYTSPKLDSSLDGNEENSDLIRNEKSKSPDTEESNKIKIGHALSELLETERVYVSELLNIIKGYKLDPRKSDLQHLISLGAEDKLNVIFGNLEEIHRFHANVFLKDLENCISSTELVALCFLQKRDTFFQLYSFYCQNISKSEQTRESSPELQQFFQACQTKLGHKLPLAAYLLKPVQRITKYQLLLKDLLRYSSEGVCCKELQQALDCMLIVLKCLNDSMHQISITGFPVDLSQQGELLLQGAFSVWVESKKDLRLRIKPMHRHLFLYQKALLFCKSTSKATPNKATYQFKHYLKMSQIGLTESVRGDAKRFEVWLQGRQEVHIIQAANLDQKQTWVNEIKKVLFNQLEEIRIKQYASLVHRPLRQTTSWEKQKSTGSTPPVFEAHTRAMSCDSERPTHVPEEEETETIESGNWSSDCSNSDDEDHPIPSGRYIALADYCAVGNSEVNMKEGDIAELLKVGCAGWWFVKMIESNLEGWAPASYLENLHYKSSRSNRSQDKLNV